MLEIHPYVGKRFPFNIYKVPSLLEVCPYMYMSKVPPMYYSHSYKDVEPLQGLLKQSEDHTYHLATLPCTSARRYRVDTAPFSVCLGH